MFGVRYKQVISPETGMLCRKCGNVKPGVKRELMDRLMAGETLTTAELTAVTSVGDVCACTQILAYPPPAINWSCAWPRWW